MNKKESTAGQERETTVVKSSASISAETKRNSGRLRMFNLQPGKDSDFASIVKQGLPTHNKKQSIRVLPPTNESKEKGE